MDERCKTIYAVLGIEGVNSKSLIGPRPWRCWPTDLQGGRSRSNKACPQRPASLLRRSVHVMINLAGEIFRYGLQLAFGNHASQPLRNPGDARNGLRPPGRTSSRSRDAVLLSARGGHDAYSIAVPHKVKRRLEVNRGSSAAVRRAGLRQNLVNEIPRRTLLRL